MKWVTLLLLTGLLVKQTYTNEQGTEITGQKTVNGAKLFCTSGKWTRHSQSHLDLANKDEKSGEYTCDTTKKNVTVFVKFRTCEDCIELDLASIVFIIIGNIMATTLIGMAVYSLSAQPRTKSFSGNKASDKKTLLYNGEGDTYQQLTAGQTSEYSALGGRKK
ncbi:hypothetical protein P4O66_017916 [Electrophorus voltai]|uniref:CD3 gamma/delta subunit Ig-like domain-containing protein n=1 Tax=Electrophorus voltai TaxID=2609070 RepID=A0AAD8YTQ5_9TELE|nr:hypothetical protein P4O66_017916 [Electrophorus voltai]